MVRGSPRPQKAQPRKMDFLGLTLVEPTSELRTRAHIPVRYAGPFVAGISYRPRMRKDDRPSVGASFWHVTFAMFAFSWRVPVLRRRHRTRTLAEFAEVVLARALSPEQQRKYMEDAVHDLRSATSQRFRATPLRIRIKMASHLEKWAGRAKGYLCGFVWHNPDGKTTTTTWYSLSGKDLEALRAWLKK